MLEYPHLSRNFDHDFVTLLCCYFREIRGYSTMMLAQRPTLSSFMTDLVSKGRIVFARDEAENALGIARGPFLDAAERQQHQGRLISPRHGFYVIVPEQYHSWGAPPPAWYIDDLMRHEEQPYYVGLLKAAELHGASHQAVMEFQIITEKRLPRIKAGRSMIAFYYRKDLDALTSAIEDQKTETGLMKVSSIELTALDLVRYPHAAGGLDHIATVLSDLGDRINLRKLAALASRFERSVVQRLGFLLERFGDRDCASTLGKHLLRYKRLPWVELDPARSADPDFRPDPIARDENWRVIVRHMPEPDA